VRGTSDDVCATRHEAVSKNREPKTRIRERESIDLSPENWGEKETHYLSEYERNEEFVTWKQKIRRISRVLVIEDMPYQNTPCAFFSVLV